MKRLLLTLFIFCFVFPQKTYAKYDPRNYPNNKYGIHIVNLSDISDAATLVNSSGGDWGYVQVVIPETDRDRGKWQHLFDQMRRLHVIPIVRIATSVENGVWKKPRIEDFDSWVTFLSSLNWPVENRYVVLFNEPNHAKEWGNTINPEEFAQFTLDLGNRLIVANSDFFILPAGLDASAGNTSETMDELQFLARAIKERPDFFTILDGWTSHSYPNPAFSSPPTNLGRGTLYTYRWELESLRQLGLQKNLPVFITETGWQHSQGTQINSFLLSPETVARYFSAASFTVWNDSGIVAITPFTFDYQGAPFDHFSWKKLGISEFYPHYDSYKNIPKTKGVPKQRERYALRSTILPLALVAGSRYTLEGIIQNVGQAIVDPNERFETVVETESQEFFTFVDTLPFMEPQQEGTIRLHMQTPLKTGTYEVTIYIKHGEDKTQVQKNVVEIVPPPSLTLNTQLGWRKNSKASDVAVLLYKDDMLLQKFTGLRIEDGKVHVEGLINVLPGTDHRIVVLVPYYLPRQHIATLSSGDTDITMKRFLPFDYNRDGSISVQDGIALLKMKPHSVFSLFFGR